VSIYANLLVGEGERDGKRNFSHEINLSHKNKKVAYLFKLLRSASVKGKNPESTRQTTNWPLRSSMFDNVC
jgi:hypothetical protein